MALFKKENANTLVLKGLVSESKYPDYTGGEGSSVFPNVSNQVVNKVLEGYNQKVNYINGNPFRADASKNDGTNSNTGSAGQPTKTSVPSSDNGWAIDIAQSHHFTVEIRDASGHKSSSGNLLNYKTPNNIYSSFLPVKNMSLSYSGYENLNIPLSIFGDFQLLQRKRVETITLTCYDEDTSFLERNLQVWNEECFPQGKYVAYMDDVVKELIYRGYTVDGRESLNVRRFVIPTGQVVVNRDYSENEAKFITFTLACVGDGSVCATGSPSVLVDMPISSSKSSDGAGGSVGGGNSADGTSTPGGGGGGSSWGDETPKVVKPSTPTPNKERTIPDKIGDTIYNGANKFKNAAKSVIKNMYPHFDNNGNRIK